MYTNVQVLLIDWEEGDLEVRRQLHDLRGVFKTFYNYPTREFSIPTKRSQTSLDDELSGFLNEHNKYHTLLIVYYGGHGDINKYREAIWKCENEDNSPFVEWQHLQSKFLNDPRADTLFLLDCCRAASVIRTTERLPSSVAFKPIVEVIAACGFEAGTPLHGEHTFTANLVLELGVQEHWDRKPHGTNVRYINARLIDRLKEFRPIAGKERRHTSTHFWLLDDPDSTRNIKLGRLPKIPDPIPDIQVPPVPEPISAEAVHKRLRIKQLRAAQKDPHPSYRGMGEQEDKMDSQQKKLSSLADKWIRLFREFQDSSMVPVDDQKHRKVKIAILSTGVDLKHPYIRQAKMIVDARNFDDGDLDVSDSYGDGTHQASVLHEIAPESELSVARITQNRYIGPAAVEKVTQAIDWAVTVAKVDIIVMPFGFAKRHPQLQDAVDRACNQNVICLAATSNAGGNSPATYPARHRRVLAINSTDGLGNPSPYNPSPREDDLNFSTLGELVEGAWPLYLGSETIEKRMSGTSVAVCVAAAILANVLEYSRTKLKLSDDLEKTLHSFEGAQAMLKLMSAKRGGYSYVAPWLLWSDDQSGEEADAKILSVIRNL